MTFIPPPLFIADKQQTANDPSRIPVAFKQLERYIGNLHIPTGGGGGGGYASLTGPGQTTTPGNLTQAGGLVVNGPFAANDSSIGGGISLTESGSGQLTLTQSGSGAIVIQLTGTSGNDIHINNNSGGGVYVSSNSSLININAADGLDLSNANTATNGTFIYDGSAPGLTIQAVQGLFLLNLPTSAPGGTHQVWNNAGVLHIT